MQQEGETPLQIARRKKVEAKVGVDGIPVGLLMGRYMSERVRQYLTIVYVAIMCVRYSSFIIGIACHRSTPHILHYLRNCGNLHMSRAFELFT